jgi:hypothetical protein
MLSVTNSMLSVTHEMLFAVHPMPFDMKGTLDDAKSIASIAARTLFALDNMPGGMTDMMFIVDAILVVIDRLVGATSTMLFLRSSMVSAFGTVLSGFNRTLCKA